MLVGDLYCFTPPDSPLKPAKGQLDCTLRMESYLDAPHPVTAQQASCQILFLQLGPLELNVLGLLIELFGETRGDPVTLTITAFRGQGLLGDLLCSVASTPLPTP